MASTARTTDVFRYVASGMILGWTLSRWNGLFKKREFHTRELDMNRINKEEEWTNSTEFEECIRREARSIQSSSYDYDPQNTKIFCTIGSESSYQPLDFLFHSGRCGFVLHAFHRNGKEGAVVTTESFRAHRWRTMDWFSVGSMGPADLSFKENFGKMKKLLDAHAASNPAPKTGRWSANQSITKDRVGEMVLFEPEKRRFSAELVFVA